MPNVPLRALLLAALSLPATSSAQSAARTLWSDPVRPGAAPARRAPVAGDASALATGAGDPLASVVEPYIPRVVLAPGPKPFVTLLCRYADALNVTPAPRAQFERNFVSPEFPSVNHYWTEMSGGRISLDGSRVAGWYDLPEPRSTYVRSGGGVDFARLERDCIALADADVHFPDFHGINIVVNTLLDGSLWAGGGVYEMDGVRRPYAVTYLDNVVQDDIGFAAHEIGHTFGLSHTSGGNGTAYDSRWDVMSVSSWWNLPGTSVQLPAHTLAYQKYTLGFIPPERRTIVGPGTTTIRLERHARAAANADPLLAVVPIPGGGGLAYFTLETRGGAGSGYDAGIPEPVVVMHRLSNFVGLHVVDADGNGDPNDDGAQLVAGESYLDRATGIRVRVDARDGTAFRVTVTVPDGGAVELDAAPHRREVAFGDRTTFSDSATVRLTGPGAATRAWRATTRSSRLRLVTASGAGPGVVRWTTQAGERYSGTFVDSIVVVASGAADSIAVVRDTLVIAQPPTLAVGLGATSSRDSVVVGRTGTLLGASVVPIGPGAEAATWTATARAPWVELLVSSDPFGGPPVLRWRHLAAGLAAGTYVDTIVVTLSGGATARLVDTLLVRPPLGLSLGRTSRTVTHRQRGVPDLDSVFVQLDGPWADGAMLQFNVGAGTPSYLRMDPRRGPGSGWLRLQRNLALAPGRHVNRLRVALAADPATFVDYEDTLVVEAAPPAIVLSAASARDAVPAGWASVDSVRVEPQGPDASSRRWVAEFDPRRIRALPRNGASPHGSGAGAQWLVWQRVLANVGPDNVYVPRPAGTYVDTIRVRFESGDGEPARLVDTVVVLGGPSLVIGASSRRAAAMAGRAASIADSAAVSVSGVDAGEAGWTATNRAAWSTLLTASGSGAGTLRWRRDAAGLAAGLYVDTITITASGLPASPKRLLDSLRVWPALSLAPAARPTATMGAAYADTIRASGGTGAATFSLASGTLPPGLAFDAATGALAGVPEAVGEFGFTLRARSDTFTVERAYAVTVAAPAVTSAAILDRLLGDAGAPGLDADQVRYLDLLGNRNGRLDVGDVRAWLRASATTTANDPSARALRALADSTKHSTSGSQERR